MQEEEKPLCGNPCHQQKCPGPSRQALRVRRNCYRQAVGAMVVALQSRHPRVFSSAFSSSLRRNISCQRTGLIGLPSPPIAIHPDAGLPGPIRPPNPHREIQLRQHQTTRPNFVDRRGNHADKITSEAEKVTSPLALNSRFCRPPKSEEGQLREGNQACFYIHRRQQLCRRSWPCNSNASFHRSSISRCGSLVELRWTFLFVFKTPEHVRNDRLPLLLIHCDSQYPR